MINKLLFILTLFTFVNAFGQDSRKMTVTYKLFIEEDAINLKNDDLRNAISLESGNLIFKLFVNDSISYFIDNNGISSENLSTKLAILKTKYITPIYCKADKSFLFNNSPNFRFFNTNEFLITQKSKSNWVITDESKMIDQNLCYKATVTDIDYGARDKNEYKITAWFCPKIPFSFGPVYYGNLPGLILEISYLDIKLMATKIEYRLDEKKIIKPEGQKLLTISEYYSKMSNTINGLMNEIQNHR